MRRTIIILVAAILFISCKNDTNGKTDIQRSNDKKELNNISGAGCPDYIKKRKDNNLNISILLDLSSRIDLPNQQIKDSAYIISLARTFNEHIKQKRLGLLYDKMELFFEPAPSNPKINELSHQLKISYVKGVSKNEWIPKTYQLYETIPTHIYELAREDSDKIGYPGSDTWRFFKDHVKDYCIEDCRRNILVVLTDGYMYYHKTIMKNGNRTSYLTPSSLDKLNLNKGNWKKEIEKRDMGFIPATTDLQDLEVLVIGTTSLNDKNPYAKDIIEAYWSKWFEEMGVKKYKIKNADIPPNIEKVIFDFILNEQS